MARTLPAAAIGALAGALLWAVLVVVTGYEFGLVAWAVGAMAGGASYHAGGRGDANGAACAMLALLGIFLGKVVAVRATEPQRIRDFFVASVDLQERYVLDQQAAQEFAALPADADLRPFLAKHRFAVGETAAAITPTDVAEFHEKDAPTLRWMARTNPEFNAYAREREEAFVRYIMAGSSVLGWAVNDLSGMDAVFALLGVGSAFHLGSGRHKADAPAPPAGAPA